MSIYSLPSGSHTLAKFPPKKSSSSQQGNERKRGGGRRSNELTSILKHGRSSYETTTTKRKISTRVSDTWRGGRDVHRKRVVVVCRVLVGRRRARGQRKRKWKKVERTDVVFHAHHLLGRVEGSRGLLGGRRGRRGFSSDRRHRGLCRVSGGRREESRRAKSIFKKGEMITRLSWPLRTRLPLGAFFPLSLFFSLVRKRRRGEGLLRSFYILYGGQF